MLSIFLQKSFFKLLKMEIIDKSLVRHWLISHNIYNDYQPFITQTWGNPQQNPYLSSKDLSHYRRKPFPTQNPAYDEIISWTEDGRSFVVKNISRLTNEVFPRHFKHTNFLSFIRQLNMYGFRKLRGDEEGAIFTH